VGLAGGALQRHRLRCYCLRQSTTASLLTSRQHAVTLVSIEDDARDEQLRVVWELERGAVAHGRPRAAMSLGTRFGLGGQPPEHLDVVDVLLPPWAAVAQVRVLLLHGEHPGDAHRQYRHAIEHPRLATEGAWRE